MGFAKLAYYCTHSKNLNDSNLVILSNTGTTLNTELAKNLFMDNTHHNLGTYIRVLPKNSEYDHSVAIINTDARGLYVYHANYGGKCLVRYQYYTWENFANAFPIIYHYAK